MDSSLVEEFSLLPINATYFWLVFQYRSQQRSTLDNEWFLICFYFNNKSIDFG